ncbi:MAG TPA: hypothetical protein PK236_02890 [Verrucomicrobiota bacterium]|nr:hypothetical protein [Verrucomicrobiota bacterium]
MRTTDLANLCRWAPNAFRLAFWIAARARYKPEGTSKHGLTRGEALIGDIKGMGLSPREYRTAKTHLAKGGYATFRATPMGTIARLTDARLFSIQPPPVRQASRQTEGKKTTSQTTNQEEAANASPARVCASTPMPVRQTKRQAEGKKATNQTTTTVRKIVQSIKNGEDAQRAAIAAQLDQLKEQRRALSKQGTGADPAQHAKRLRLLDAQIQAHADSLP